MNVSKYRVKKGDRVHYQTLDPQVLEWSTVVGWVKQTGMYRLENGEIITKGQIISAIRSPQQER